MTQLFQLFCILCYNIIITFIQGTHAHRLRLTSRYVFFSGVLHQNYNYFTCKAHLIYACSQIVFALLVPSFQQVWNKNNLVDIIRLVAKLFQQVRYSHNITILLQPCVVNLLTFLFSIMTVSDLLEQPCNKSDNAIKLVTSC